MPTQTDRDKIKKQQKGTYLTAAGIADHDDAVNELHEATFSFDLDADAAQVERGISVDKAFRIKSVKFTPTTALAAHAANYVTLTVSKRDGAGGAAVVSATTNTNTAGANVSLAAFVPATLALSATSANLDFAAGNVLTFLSAETGTPVTPIGRCSVTVEYV